MRKIYGIFFNGCFDFDKPERPTFRGMTRLSPKEWLKEYNKKEIAKGNKPKLLEEFDFHEGFTS